jgi:hypothetical protein
MTIEYIMNVPTMMSIILSIFTIIAYGLILRSGLIFRYELKKGFLFLVFGAVGILLVILTYVIPAISYRYPTAEELEIIKNYYIYTLNLPIILLGIINGACLLIIGRFNSEELGLSLVIAGICNVADKIIALSSVFMFAEYRWGESNLNYEYILTLSYVALGIIVIFYLAFIYGIYLLGDRSMLLGAVVLMVIQIMVIILPY